MTDPGSACQLCDELEQERARLDVLLRYAETNCDAAHAERREARMLYNEAVTILLECAHGDEQTCGCKDRALERLAGLAAIRAQGGEK